MPKPFRGVVSVDIRDSVPDWEPFLQPKAPEGAPNGGSFFDMAPIGEALWVVDSVNGQVLQVTPAGEITRENP